jgi:predicted ester cyclase
MKKENEALVKQYIENILSTGDDKELSEFFSPHYTEVYNNKRYRLGIEGMRKKIANIQERYTDLTLSVDVQTTIGEWVVTSYNMKGTQLGRWMGLVPTTKTVEVWAVNIDKVVDGKITEHASSTHLLDPLIVVRKHPIDINKEYFQKLMNAKNDTIEATCEIISA